VIDHQDRTSRKQNALGPITVDHAGITKGGCAAEAVDLLIA